MIITQMESLKWRLSFDIKDIVSSAIAHRHTHHNITIALEPNTPGISLVSISYITKGMLEFASPDYW